MRPDSTRLIRIVAAGSSDVGPTEELKGAMSFSEIRQALCQAFGTAFPGSGGDIVDLYPDKAIIRDASGTMYEVPYSIDEEGKVTTGDMAKVRKQIEYVRMNAALSLMGAAGEATNPDYGYKWHVQILVPGPDKQGLFDYLQEAVRAAAPVYEGAKVFALSQGQHADPKNPYGKSVRDLVGWIDGVAASASGLEGTLHIMKTASWLRDQLVELEANKQLSLLGLSHDVQGQVGKVRGAGPRPVEKIVRVDSVDVVYDPIAGGKFLRMAAAGQTGGADKEAKMLVGLLAALKIARPEEYQKLMAAGKVTDGNAVEGKITEGEVMALFGAAPGFPAQDNKEAKEILEQTRIASCGITLNAELAESGLPVLAANRVRKQFEGRAFETEALRAAIKEEKEYIDKITGSGSVQGAGGLRGGLEEPEKIQAAMDKMFGVDVDEKFKDVPAMTGLRAAYVHLTGDDEVTGRPDRMSREAKRIAASYIEMLRLPAAYDSASFTYALGNSMYRRLIQDYREVDYFESFIISNERNAKDFKTIESILITYPGDMPDIDPESGDYVEEIGPATDAEVAYHVNQKGRIITVTRKTIINDDLSVIQRILSRRGRAARRTFAKRVWNPIINNAVYLGDSKNVFHADHGNLGAVTLTNDATGIQTLTNRKVAMFNQTEPGSGEKLALRPRYLCVPIELESNAFALNQPWPIAGTINPNAGLFGRDNERIITHPLFTDTTDWVMLADKTAVEMIEVAYLNGQKEPQLFVADNPLVGQMFSGDKLQYKERHEYEAAVMDYRGFDKSVS